jgi:hypothetical protein
MHERHEAREMREVRVSVEGVELDFEAASGLAKQAASHATREAMLLAWFDRRKGKECPEVPECMHKPGWIAYAESRGADMRVVVNDGEYVFLFRPATEG